MLIDVCSLPLSELIGMYFLCYCQLNGHRVVVHVAVVIVVASVRAVIKIMGYGLENTRVPRGDPVSGSTSTPFHTSIPANEAARWLFSLPRPTLSSHSHALLTLIKLSRLIVKLCQTVVFDHCGG
jgi:hypothetical protein